MKVQVIVSRCVPGTFPGAGHIFGDRLVDKFFSTVEEAMAEGKLHCADERGVVVRPTYNETDADGSFYREWRSFNGDILREVRFGF